MNTTASKFIAFAFTTALTISFGASAAGPAARHQDVVRDERGNTVVDSNGGCVRTAWTTAKGNHCSNRGNSVYFDFNRSALTSDGRATLTDIVAFLKTNHVKSITIVGYADSIGKDSYNLRLSQKRAEHVKSFIESKGYHGGTIEVRGMGESNMSEKQCNDLSRKQKIGCLWQERRVDIELNM